MLYAVLKSVEIAKKGEKVFYISLQAGEMYSMAVFSSIVLLVIALTVNWTEGGNSHILIKSRNSLNF